MLRSLTLVLGVACTASEPAPPPLPEPLPELPPPEPSQVVADSLPEQEPELTWHLTPAFADDPDYASTAAEPARRIVYRMSLIVPRSLGSGSPEVAGPTAELYIDVARDRLRARFGGNGWPVHAGSEVRLRRDEPGVYLLDGEGGRPLGPGQLAQWFEGGRPRSSPGLRIATPATNEQSGPGDLICRLIAEWTNNSPDSLARRCGEGGSPPSFRVGLWRGERTADVGVELPRSQLRADHVDPPRPVAPADSRAFLPPAMMARFPPRRERRNVEPDPSTNGEAPGEGLLVENRGPTRTLVTIDGTPIGWVDAGVTAHYVGLRPGMYEVGGVRPFGLQAARVRPVRVPGRVRLPR
ncbi:MAG: hypothetical protein H6722_22090 [Sandaracinus sp.]|nr:hypothetical protein [Sandaracinus sp.]